MSEESSFDAPRYPGEFSSSFVPPPPPVPAYELRPLTTGEILDRTFYLYRGNFWLFTGISAIAAGAATLTSIAQLLYNHFSHPAAIMTASDILRNTSGIVLSAIAGIVYLVVYSVAHAATVSAVLSIYLGDSTSNAQAFRAVRPRWLRYTGIALWQIWSASWLFLVAFVPLVLVGRILGVASGGMVFAGLFAFAVMIGGFVYGIIAYIRNSLAVPVEVTEGLPVRAAMRRSKDLTAGTKGRIFGLFVLLFVLYIVAGGMQAPIGMLIVKAGPTGRVSLFQILSLCLNFVMTTLVTPVGAIGLCLFYIDQRVRMEGFDIQFLLDRSSPPPAPPPPATAPPLETPVIEIP
jgi:uncharacterized membrane protein